MSSTTYGVALLGFGTVGRGVYDLLHSKAAFPIQQKHGVDFQVRHVLVRNPKNPKYADLPEEIFAKDIRTITEDAGVDIVIEVMGGIEPAKEYFLAALSAGKAVITANKALMATCGDELVKQAKEQDRFVGYSAAITGAHQLAESVANSVMVRSLRGVFNGTSNYILTRMEEENLDFDVVLKEAQEAGYAEMDPSADVDGFDTRHKLVLLTNLAFGVFVDETKILTTGIRNVQKRDVKVAAELGYKIKLVGETQLNAEGQLESQVGACLIPSEDLLSRARGINNAIEVDDRFRGLQGMIAEGAGAEPTAMAIYSDLVNFVRGKSVLWPMVQGEDAPKVSTKKTVKQKFYLRFEVKNSPGTLAVVSNELSRHTINIGSVFQPEADDSSATAELVLTCGPTVRSELESALKDVAALDEVVGEPFFLPIIKTPDPLKAAA
jgi:homoserine dehydrogenase